jgi:hypothetical protein
MKTIVMAKYIGPDGAGPVMHGALSPQIFTGQKMSDRNVEPVSAAAWLMKNNSWLLLMPAV